MTFLTNLTRPNLTYNFEISNNLGGENTHLNSMLRTHSAAISACCGGRRNVADRRIPSSAIARSRAAPFLSFERTLSLSAVVSRGSAVGTAPGTAVADRQLPAFRPSALSLSLSLAGFRASVAGLGVETHPFSGLSFAARQRNGASAPFDDFPPFFVCVCVGLV